MRSEFQNIRIKLVWTLFKRNHIVILVRTSGVGMLQLKSLILWSVKRLLDDYVLSKILVYTEVCIHFSVLSRWIDKFLI